MSRPGYTNVPPTEERMSLFATIANHLALDPEQHSARLNIIDYALRKAAREIEEINMSWIKSKYPVGARITTPSRVDPKATTEAEVVNHYTGTFNRIEGIVVRDDDGNTYNIEAGVLNEQGGGV